MHNFRKLLIYIITEMSYSYSKGKYFLFYIFRMRGGQRQKDQTRLMAFLKKSWLLPGKEHPKFNELYVVLYVEDTTPLYQNMAL